ncbi:oxidoreductase [Ornithinimicrobium pekingense]|uniref:Oxidoreductase n=2 Tax=Ornithinimicrobium pekingense TaxID=384677 RepID=A0ABQ2FDX6_9MICO|nr:oxidoreductase [Ornithinimicrobium pekingense]
MAGTTNATMEHRAVPRLGRELSVVGLGCWQLGADWGDVPQERAVAILEAAADAGVTFLDTADVYGDGRSERLVGAFVHEHARDRFTVATKMGRRADPHTSAQFTPDNLRRWNDRSRELLGDDTLDLVQLHCPPTEVYHRDDVFDTLDEMVAEGRMRAYGVSVETVAEALAAIARPHVASVQIILNVFRRKPLEEVTGAGAEAGVGIIARVPLASGLLTGKFDETSTFADDDHRQFNRHGEAFDVGETFAGVPYEVGVQAAREFSAVDGPGTPAQRALRWIVDQPGVTTTIPGASSPDQARANAAAAALPPPTEEAARAYADLYDRRIREHVHGRW